MPAEAALTATIGGKAAGAAAAAFQSAAQASVPQQQQRRCRAGLPWHGVDLAAAPALEEVRLPPVLRVPPLPDDPGLDGFAAAATAVDGGGGGGPAAANSPVGMPAPPPPAGTVADATNPFADPAPAPPHAAILIRAAVTAWGPAADPAASLVQRVAYGRWLAGRLGLRPLDTPAALGAALSAAARTAPDLRSAAASVRQGRELPGVYARTDWAADDAGKAAAAAGLGDAFL
jgi:hypothetical protein